MPLSVSVVIPSLEMAHVLAQAVASVMRQDMPVSEILVVDSRSTDGTPDLARALAQEGAPVRLIADERRGPGQARNLGIAEARGDVIGFVDADDIWPEGKLARQLARLEAEPRMDVVGGFVVYCDRIDPVTLAPDPEGRIEPPLFGAHVGACLFRAGALAQLNGFDESFLYSEDVDLMLRVRESDLGFTILRETTLYYHRTGNSMMDRSDPRKWADFRRAVALSLTRRRGADGTVRELPAFASYLEPAAVAETSL